MSDQGSDGDQVARKRDAILRRLLTTPPQSRAALAEQVRRAKEKKPTRKRRAGEDAAVEWNHAYPVSTHDYYS